METERERPHRSTSSNSSSTSELFVCFTSRLSSSSMKLSSKSILSPSRSRDPPQISLSSSLSRRLKSNGSIKGGQASPMFPTNGGKRRGCGFENPEPSSPKVTCIGQVRVKTKKQGKKMRARSKRRGEASFRKVEQVGPNANPDLTRQSSQGFQQHRNQRWVHLPLTICEALREFNCFFPCRSSCMSSEKEKEKKGGGGVEGGGGGVGHGGEGSCGDAFGKWLVALQEGEGKGRGIELVMQEEEDGRERGERSYSQRRHVFEDIDVDLVVGEEEENKVEDVGGDDEEKARVSICIPPKNALLLMRCRSDPVKMAALANRFWESPVHKDNKCQQDEDDEDEDSADEDEEEEEEQQEGQDEKEQHIKMKQDEQVQQVESETNEDSISERETETAVVATAEEEQSCEIESRENENLESKEFSQVKEEEEKVNEEEQEEANGNAIEKGETLTLPEANSDLDNLKTEEKEVNLQEDKEEQRENLESSELSPSPETFTASEPENNETEAQTEAVTAETSEGSTEEEEEKATTEDEHSQKTDPTREPNSDPESKERENGSKRQGREREALPECLLLMMCEPKLSMEVSKETWVCSTDFIRWLPERPSAGKRVAGETLTKPKPKPKPSPPMMQPPRSSCSFPAAGGGGGTGVSMATMIEQKLMGSPKSGNNGYEPFVLTRCKSEPMRSSAKLAPDACFWNNRKLEPHPPAAQLGVGAPAGVGF